MRTLLLCGLLAAAAGAQAGEDPPPNVLVIVADDLGVDYVDCYQEGTNPPPTPTLDSLAARGVLFRNAWANPSCSPTRASLHTGRFPFRHLVGRWIRYPNNSEPIGTLQPREWTVPRILDRADSGYGHALIGKYHLSDVTQGLRTPYTQAGWGYWVGHLWGQVSSYYAWERVENGVESISHTYITTQQTDDAIAWISQQTGPWCCYLTYTAPHLPFEKPPAALFTQTLSSSPSQRDLYRVIIEAMDTEMGRLFTTLGDDLDNTNIVFIGDNGSVQNMAVAPFIGSKAKGTPYEGGLNVPLLIAGPAVASGGREVTALACAVDVVPTVIEMAGASAGVPTWVPTDGVSLMPYLSNPSQTPLRDFAYAEEFRGDVWPKPNTNGYACVRDARYKLIHRYTSSDALYDLQNDPWETTNLLNGSLSAQEAQAHAALLGEISRLRGQPAAWYPLGSSVCTGSNGVPTIQASAPPRVGSQYLVQVHSAAPNSSAVLLVGVSATNWLGLPLPFDLSTIGGGTGCTLYSSGDLLAVTLSTTGTGLSTGIVSLPYWLSLVDWPIFHSWLILDPTAPGNNLGLVSTTALAGTIGL